MPKIDSLLETTSQLLISSTPKDMVYFATIVVQYSQSQPNFNPDTARNCNFNFVSGDMRGTGLFKTEFYGLTGLPAAIRPLITD